MTRYTLMYKNKIVRDQWGHQILFDTASQASEYLRNPPAEVVGGSPLWEKRDPLPVEFSFRETSSRERAGNPLAISYPD